MNIGALRARIRASRDVPVLGAAVRAADRLWWYRVIRRSGLVDAEFYAAQLGLSRMPADAALWHYVARGFRRGLSLNPLFDEVFAGGGLPEVFRVPALYAYLVGERATIAVHPWWDAVAMTGTDGLPGLERAWGDKSSELSLRVGQAERSMPVTDIRASALQAARSWRRPLAAGVAGRRHDGVDPPLALIRMVQARDRRYHLKLSQAVRLVESGRASVSVPMVGVDASQWISASLLAEIEPRLGLHGHRDSDSWADVLTDEVARLGRPRTIAVLDARAEFADSEIEDLAAAAGQSLVIPAHRALDGTLAGVGAASVGPGPAYRVLSDHPHEDVALIPDRILEVPLATGRTFAVDLEPYRAVGGLRADTGEELEGLSRRLALAGTPSRVLLDILPVLEEPELAFRQPKRRRAVRGRSVEADRLRAEAILSDAGFTVQRWELSGVDAPVPVLAWRRPTPDAQRWAIKICAPPGRQGAVWGDTHFATGLAAALRRRGHSVVIDAFEARYRRTGYLDDVSVVVRGPYRIDAPEWGTSLEWIISHPDDISRAELSTFDRVFAASATWSRHIGDRWGIHVEPLLEATDTDLFRPAGLARGSDVVFVGTARGIARPSVVVPLAAGIPVRVYGPDWRPFIPHSAIVARSISNTDLPARYETASVVLNDQWPAMRREGFIAMRPFDAVAVGGRVISEEVDGIEEIFEGAVIVYRDADHLVDLLKRDPDDLFPSPERLAEISERVRREHSFDARAAVLDAAAGEAARGASLRRR